MRTIDGGATCHGPGSLRPSVLSFLVFLHYVYFICYFKNLFCGAHFMFHVKFVTVPLRLIIKTKIINILSLLVVLDFGLFVIYGLYDSLI